MNINKFRQSFTTGIARANRFKCIIIPPVALTNYKDKDLSYRCFASELPSKSIVTNERRTYGPVIKTPYSDIVGGEITLSFICSGDLSERKLFDSWMNKIIDISTWDISYYSEYTTDLYLHVMDESDKVNAKYKFIEAYPATLGSQRLDWSENDSYIVMDVTFNYNYYKVEE